MQEPSHLAEDLDANLLTLTPLDRSSDQNPGHPLVVILPTLAHLAEDIGVDLCIRLLLLNPTPTP